MYQFGKVSVDSDTINMNVIVFFAFILREYFDYDLNISYSMHTHIRVLSIIV